MAGAARCFCRPRFCRPASGSSPPAMHNTTSCARPGLSDPLPRLALLPRGRAPPNDRSCPALAKRRGLALVFYRRRESWRATRECLLGASDGSPLEEESCHEDRFVFGRG